MWAYRPLWHDRGVRISRREPGPDGTESSGSWADDARRVAVLALPALVVLAAEPVYVLVDTAVVGHLRGTALASLAVGGSVLTFATWLGNVIAYGTTGRAARRFGAGDRPAAVAEGVQASWLALTAGVIIAILAEVLAGPVARTLAGPHPGVADGAVSWLRIAALGAPGLLLATAGNGWMRGVQDTRRPLRYVLAANLLSAVLCPILVYPAGLGLVGSAIANATAQTVAGALFVTALIREREPLRPRPALIRSYLVVSRDLLVRGAAFQACFLSATAVASRFGPAALSAHAIALQLWLFCSLAMDAVAIAAQALIGAALGGSRPAAARTLARRIAVIGFGCGTAFAVLIAVGAHALPTWFSPDPHVYAQTAIIWPWFVAMQPIAGVVFAIDGVLIGAGDLAFLRNLTVAGALAGFLPSIWLAFGLDLGLRAIWFGLTLFVVIRFVGSVIRLRDGRWAVPGASMSSTGPGNFPEVAGSGAA
jgi:putative MATE family efflux protein